MSVPCVNVRPSAGWKVVEANAPQGVEGTTVFTSRMTPSRTLRRRVCSTCTSNAFAMTTPPPLVSSSSFVSPAASKARWKGALT